MTFLETLTNQYSLSKTLRFELKPCDPKGIPIQDAQTITDYKNNLLSDIISEDQKRASEYKKVKLIMDDYHRAHIEKALSSSCLIKNDLLTPSDIEEAYEIYNVLKKDSSEAQLKKWGKAQEGLRKKVKKALTVNKHLFSKELITQELPRFLEDTNGSEASKEAVRSFHSFTTYFSGFHENRKNMYTDQEQATAIPYRSINENLTKFFLNVDLYQRIKAQHPELAQTLRERADQASLQSLSIPDLDTLFCPASFIHLLSQRGITLFQRILGGESQEDRTKIPGLKELVNLSIQSKKSEYSQAKSQEDLERVDLLSKEIRSLKKCLFIPLFKQILSDTEKTSYVPEGFESDSDLLQALTTFVDALPSYLTPLRHCLQQLRQEYKENLDRIYLKPDRIGELSTLFYGQRMFLTEVLEQERLRRASEQFKAAKNGKVSKSMQEKRAKYTIDLISIHEMDQLLHNALETLEVGLSLPKNANTTTFSVLVSQLLDLETPRKGEPSLEEALISLRTRLLEKDSLTLSSDRRLPCPEERPQGGLGYQQVSLIKEPLDQVLRLVHSLGHFSLIKDRKPMHAPDADRGFYALFTPALLALEDQIITLYNKTRNYLSKKPYSREKIKINFNKSTFLNGWDVNKESANLSLLFRRNGLYYLGVMSPKANKSFDYTPTIDDFSKPKTLERKQALKHALQPTNSEEAYEKMTYKLLPGASKMLPKVCFSDKRIDLFAPSDEIMEIRNTASHTKNGTPQKGFSKAPFDLSDCHQMIDFYKRSIDLHPEWRQYNFTFTDTRDYEDISAFYREVEEQAYVVSFDQIKATTIEELIEAGKLSLFQLYNKDFSPYAKGAPNLHTLYWKSLFPAVDNPSPVAKLNGEAEMFFREHSLTTTPIHKAGEAVANKDPNNPKRHSSFSYDLIKDKRFTQDKFFLHVPITLNFLQPSAPNPTVFNEEVNKLVSSASDYHIIGIDRGERNLLCYSVVSSDGVLIEQGDLNSITTDQGYDVDYHQKLAVKEQQRDSARKSWGEIEHIKELKAGYLSHVVHKIALLIEQYNAIVCLEDLNFGFKRGRFKVEKQVYQKFEKALLDKLNYLVFKGRTPQEAGHHQRAYQLTAPFESFQKLGKQSGILYYVTAAHTSKICPATGFINYLDLRYKSLGRALEFFERVEDFSYNASHQRFELTFSYDGMDSFASRAPQTGRQRWTLGTHGSLRYRTQRTQQQWESVAVNSTEEVSDLLAQVNIIGEDGQNLCPQILATKGAISNPSGWFKQFFRALDTAFSLRQSVVGSNVDFILSPVVLPNGGFFDSRASVSEGYPRTADENGAYHIALKGLWTQRKMQDSQTFRVSPLSNADWVPFAQEIAATKAVMKQTV